MRSQYFLLVLWGVWGMAPMGASQASDQNKGLKQMLVDPLLQQSESKMAEQKKPKMISTDQLFKKLDEARANLESNDNEQQKKAAQIYQAMVTVATQYAKDAQAEGRKHGVLDMITSTALNDLGYCYELGKGVTQDKNHAFELYKQAVALGNLSKWWNYQALYNLARCYEKGIGIRKDAAEATKLLNQAYVWYGNFVKLYPMYANDAFDKGVKKALETRKKTEDGPKRRSVSISVQNGEEPIELSPISYQRFDE